MAEALSGEEFQRMQAQLLELRSENYRLSDELRKNGAELSGLRARVQALDKDLARANKALSKSKKAQEVEALLGETRMLQGKLQSQEDDFPAPEQHLAARAGQAVCADRGVGGREPAPAGRGGPGPPQIPREPPQDAVGGDPPAPPEAPPEPPQEQPLPEEEERGDTAPGDPPEPPSQPEVMRLQAEVDELTAKLQEQQARARELREQELRELQEQNQRLREQLEAADEAQRGLRERLEAQAQELQRSRAQREALDAQLQGLRGRLAEAEAARDGSERQRQEEAATAQEHGERLQRSLEELQAALAEAEQQRERLESEGRALRQELKDVRDGQRILEKKGSAALKDLKRQLQLERRRGDRLQERLQELLAPNRNRTGLEELGLEGGDSSSLSSLGRDGSAPGSTKSGSGSPGGGSGGAPAGLSPAEVAELFQRLAQSQQERWLLEEKVRHLEVSSASMAEDLCRKSAIIQSFVRDSRLEAAAPPAAPRRGEDGLREMNKKLQNLLEEQMTKNLSLGRVRGTGGDWEGLG
ncbi:GRIP1-associated protein 1, partial [Phaenicophaeus curvirostris]|uniref:GRIP1-associated protein 1 n=1 Tax=Phaenicophaeus curvirostris TaxID=33595 RepID=UPI0037F09E20